MSTSGQDSTIDNASSRGESYAIGNGFGLTAGHVLFSISFKRTKTVIAGATVPQIQYSIATASGYSAESYMDTSYQSAINTIATEYMNYYNAWYVNYYTWLSAYQSWSSGGGSGQAPVLSLPGGNPPYGQMTPASGAVTPQQAAKSLLQPPTQGEVLNDPRAKAVDSVLAKSSAYKTSENDPGLVLFYNSSDFSGASYILNGSTEHFEIGDSAIGQNSSGLVYPNPGSKNQLPGDVLSSVGAHFTWSRNAFPSNSGSAGIVSWSQKDYVFGNLVATPPKSPQQFLPDGSQAVAQGVGSDAIGVSFTYSDFYNLNTILEASSSDPGRDPQNLIVGVNTSNRGWQVSGGGKTYSYSLGSIRRDLFVGTSGNEAFYASAGDTVDVGTGNNFVAFNPAGDPTLQTNGNMTVDFGRTASGDLSGNTVVEVDTSADNRYDYVLDLSSDPNITPDNIDLIAGGQSLYWYPGVPGGQLAEQGGDSAFNSQWLSNADVEFLSVIDGGSTITFVDNKEKVGIETTDHVGMFSANGISPITTIRFAEKGANGQNITWDAADIFNYIKEGEESVKGNGGIDFLQGYGIASGTNLDANGDFDQYFLPDPLKGGQSSISTTQPVPALADASFPQVTDFADASSGVLVTGQSDGEDANTLYASANGQTLDPNGTYAAVHGDGGGDTFVYNKGYGTITVEEADQTSDPANVLQLGSGLTATNAIVAATDSGDVTLDFGNGDSVVLAGELLSDDGTSYGLQQVDFADGTVWTYADLLARLETSSSGSPVLFGDASANVLDGKGVSKTLEGFGGGDTFVFNQGYGELAVEERALTGSAANILKLGVGLAAANTTVTADASGTITLDFGNGDQVWLEDQLNSGNGTSFGVQQIQFAEGTVWTESDLVARLDTVNANSTTLYGDNTGHTFDPEDVDNAIVSNGGGDTFLYNQGYGALTITESDESANPDNILQLGSGITAAGTTVAGDSNGDLILDFGNGDTITLSGALDSGNGTTYGVQTVQFADGTAWSYADLIAAADTPSATNTTLYASTGSYVLDGQGVATTLIAAGGGDTFVYNQGYGALTISEFDTSASPDNVLQIGAGLSASSLVVTGDSNGDMILSFGGGDAITLTDGLMSGDGVAYGVQEVAFADGTTLSYANLLALAETSSATQTTLYGDTGANTLDGRGVAHTLVGQGGDTTFVFNQGYGPLTIDATDVTDPSPSNVLQLGSGLTAADMAVTANANGDLILDFGSGDAVTITNALNSSGAAEYGVQQVNFADGSSLTYAQLLTLADTPSASNAILYGDTGANTLDGAGIAHTLVGNGGGDTFVFNQGYGALTITENDPDFGDTNILQLGAGISAANTSVSADANGNLILNFGNGDVVTIQGALNSAASTMNGIQQVNFADGTTWNYAQMLTLADTGTAVNTTLYGDGQGDTFNPDGFAHTIDSTGGGDTINYAQGDGALTINEADTSGFADNSLILGAGLLESNTVVSTDANNDIILSFGNGDVVTLASAMTQSDTTAYGVQNVQFADGTTWSLADLRYQISPTAAGMAVVDGDFAETVNADLLDGGGWVNGGFEFTDSDTNDVHSVSVDSVSASGTVDPSLTNAQLLGFLQTNVGSDTSGTDSGTINWAFSGASAFDYLQAGQSVTLDYVVSVSDGQGGELKQDVSVTVTASQSGGSQLTLYGSGVTINYAAGRGNLYVNDIAGIADPNNTLAFGAGIDPSMVTLRSVTDPEATAGDLMDTLQLVVAGSGTITLADALSDPTAGVQTVTFADGTVWTYAQMIAMLGIQHPSEYGGAVVVGGTSADTLDSQGIAHVAQGNGGGDTFIYNRGYGALDIIELDQTSDVNTLAFGAGIAPSDVTVTMSGIDQFKLSLGNGDVVTFEGSGGGISNTSYQDSNARISVTVANDYTGVEQVTFADGTVWSIGQLVEQQTPGSSGILYGTEGSGIFDTKGIANTIDSEGSNDQIIYNLGYGALTINENPTGTDPGNTIVFGPGITVSMLNIVVNGNDIDISLDDQDSITIANGVGGGAIQNFAFSDGTVLDYSQLIGAAAAAAEAAAEADPVHYYQSGDGALTINEQAAQPGYDNTLYLNGLSVSDQPGSVNYSIDASGDLTLNFGGGDVVTILHEYNSDGSVAADGVQYISGLFSSDISNLWFEARQFDAGVGQTSLTGDGLGGIFDPEGNAREISDTGSNVDTILYNTGDGPLTIGNLSSNYGDSIVFGAGITLSSLSFSADANGDLIISAGGSDQITIKNGMWLSWTANAFPVENLVFSDGTTAYNYGNAVYGSDNSTVPIDVSALGETLIGDSGAQFFMAQGLARTIIGGGGADQIEYYGGDGQLTINETDASGVSSSVLDISDDLSLTSTSSGSTPPDLGSAVGVTEDAAGDVTLYLGGGDNITLLGQLSSSTGAALGVSEIIASDYNGHTDTWTNTDIENALAYEASTGVVPNFEAMPTVTAVDQSGFATDNWTPVTITAAELMQGASDSDSSATFTLASVQDAVGGSVALVDGAVVFTPDGTTTGAASFTYTLAGDSGGLATATANLTISLHDIVGVAGGSITGGNISAELDGSAGNETVTAGSAGDMLIGGAGDTLYGGAGADTFAFHANFGQQTVYNFDTNSDVLQFDTNVFSDWAHLLGATQQQGSDLLITLDTSDTITLKNVSLASFSSADAKFV